MKAIATVCLVMFSSWTVLAQQSKVTFKTKPKTAVLLLDGDTIGPANERKVAIGFNERKGIVEHEVLIVAPGYVPSKFVFDQETPIRKVVFANLERALPTLSLDKSFTIDFDKVISGIPYSTNVGSNTKWKYKINEEVVLGARRSEILGMMDKMKMPTLNSSTLDPKPTVGDLLIVGKVTSLEIKRGTASDNFYAYSPQSTSITTITWMFVDRRSDEVVFEASATSDYEFYTEVMNDEFYAAIVDNFAVLFGTDPTVKTKLIAYAAQLQEEKERKLQEEIRRQEVIKKAKADSIALALAEDTLILPFTPDSSFLKSNESTPSALMPIRKPEFSVANMETAVPKMRNATVSVKSSGSSLLAGGTIISADGYIVTTSFKAEETLMVQFANGILLQAKVVSNRDDLGISLVKVDAQNLPALAVVDASASLPKAESVTSWNAAQMRSLTANAVSGNLIGKQDYNGVRYLLTNFAASQVSPGAGVLNARGELIGVLADVAEDANFEGLKAAVDARYLYYVFGLKYE